MAFFLAVANRKGGVGKSTVSVMLAHALSVWGEKRVLVVDLDAQCNASLILIGGQGWSEARKANRNIGDYFFDLFDGQSMAPKDYLLHGVVVARFPAQHRRRLRRITLRSIFICGAIHAFPGTTQRFGHYSHRCYAGYGSCKFLHHRLTIYYTVTSSLSDFSLCQQ